MRLWDDVSPSKQPLILPSGAPLDGRRRTTQIIKGKAGRSQSQGQGLVQWTCQEAEEATTAVLPTDCRAVAGDGGLEAGRAAAASPRGPEMQRQGWLCV